MLPFVNEIFDGRRDKVHPRQELNHMKFMIYVVFLSFIAGVGFALLGLTVLTATQHEVVSTP